MRRRAIGYAIAGTILLAVSAVSAYLAHARASGPAARVNLDFTLKDVNGADVHLADLRGKPLLVNFWGTWCPPCVIETPELVDLAAQYKDRGLVIVGIAYNDTPEDVRKFAEKFGIPYQLLMSSDQAMDAFGLIDGFPTSFFVRPDGQIAGKQVGLATKGRFQEQIEGLLSE